MENKLEGVDSGVKDLLNNAQLDSRGGLGDVIGLVADLIKVNVQHAELVDLALGEYAKSLVVDGNQLVSEILSGKRKLSGRVRILGDSTPDVALELVASAQLGFEPAVLRPAQFQHEAMSAGHLEGDVQPEALPLGVGGYSPPESGVRVGNRQLAPVLDRKPGRPLGGRDLDQDRPWLAVAVGIGQQVVDDGQNL